MINLDKYLILGIWSGSREGSSCGWSNGCRWSFLHWNCCWSCSCRHYNISGQKVTKKKRKLKMALNKDLAWCNNLSETFRIRYETGDESVCQKLRSVLVGIQTGTIEDTKGWVTCINWETSYQTIYYKERFTLHFIKMCIHNNEEDCVNL